MVDAGSFLLLSIFLLIYNLNARNLLKIKMLKKIQKIPPDPVGSYHSRHICIFLKKPGKKIWFKCFKREGSIQMFFLEEKNVIKFDQCVICDSVSNRNPVSQSLVIFMKVPI